jgi:hypothetical protein
MSIRRRLYWNELEKDEYVTDCSDIDDVIVFFVMENDDLKSMTKPSWVKILFTLPF